MNLKEIRWKQRFHNFEKSYRSLDKYADQVDYTELERAGMIQLFEMTFELGWKVMKDYLESEGYDVRTPREAIKKSYEIELVEDGELWLLALNDRNLTTHAYSEEEALKMVEEIRDEYAPMLGQLYGKLKEKLEENG